MDNKEMNELFFGKDLIEKKELFKNELLEIENRHRDYFESRKVERMPGHDLLHFHYTMLMSNGGIQFNFLPGTDLSETIKTECIEAFKKVFPGASQNS